ncbi:unnamed protein product [Polarella glacialis]|uniref:Fe2OG dioxygenase domain-containing protein n=1 Tax=Polarella glacialis TaxID=89957 RepID=A0A813LN11_POLGL|nr:unnamed protein product [Polarella glacialis]|mmetsp:Transcript_87980/g.158620  ORF Transcript_87980/g.158620 Transcript_87980/m.158620 type:complete len:266 (-) Transcript_87980:32-829(-)
MRRYVLRRHWRQLCQLWLFCALNLLPDSDASVGPSAPSSFFEVAATVRSLWARPCTAKAVWGQLSGPGAPGRALHEDVPVRLVEGLLGASEAEELLRTARRDQASHHRSRERADVSDGPAARRLRRAVSDVLLLPEEHLEPLRLVQYSRPGDAFESHVDWIADEDDPQLDQLGQRVVTALVYLTDVPEGSGGETWFPKLGISVLPRMGTALIWPNVDPSGRPLPETEHEARPLTARGVTKAAVNVWVRDRKLPTDEKILASLFLS